MTTLANTRPPPDDIFRHTQKHYYIHRYIVGHFPLLIFLASYLCLTVAGNLIYLWPVGREMASHAIGSTDFFALPGVGSTGYWCLLFLPFVVAPPIAVGVRKLVSPMMREAGARLTWLELRRSEYLIIAGVCYSLVIYHFWRSNALSLARRGGDYAEAVAARFELLDTLGFWPRALLQSLLVFLAVYSLVQACRCNERFWQASAAFNVIAMTVLFTLFAMKWPLLMFYAVLVLAIFLLTTRHPFLKAGLGLAALVITYLPLSVIVLRLAAIPDVAQSINKEPVGDDQNLPHKPVLDAAQNVDKEPFRDSAQDLGKDPVRDATSHPAKSPAPHATPKSAPAPVRDATPSRVYAPALKTIAVRSVDKAPYLGNVALHRMALPYPFYYSVFSTEGPVCGTILDRIQRKTNPCQPSLLIYERMFGQDGFEGRGTTPAAVHITGYALSGWGGAAFSLVLASVVLGVFAALPLTGSAIVASAAVMGGFTAYFFSQLPFEGPIVYDHGMLWWFLPVVFYLLARHWIALLWTKTLIPI